MERKMFDTPVLPRLETILAEVKSGDLVVPQFQRPFVWDDDRRLNLLDSIVRGMPIGSLLVWRTNRRDLLFYDKIGGIQLAGPSKGNEKVNYLMDGHQRISTLFGALYPEDRGPSEDDQVRWPLYYDLAEQDRPAFRLPPRRGTPPAHWLPLNILLDGDKLFDFTQRLRANGKRDLAKDAERLANIFRDYIIPVVPMVTEELDTVTDAFVRINSQGKGMSEAHMLRALTHLESIDTASHFEEVREQLEPLGWGNLDDQILVNVLKAQLGLDVYASNVREVRDRLREDPEPLKRLTGVLSEVVTFLAEIGVRGPGALPYAYQLVALAALAAKLPGILAKPEVQELLTHWFWVTTYTEHFTGMTGTQIRDAIHHIVMLAQGHDAAMQVNIVEPLTRLRMPSVRARGFLLFLAGLPSDREARMRQQKRLGTGDSQAVLSLFPAQSRAHLGNRVIADPSELKEIRKALDSAHLPPKTIDEFGIPASALRELPNRGAFLETRARWLIDTEREFIRSLDLVVADDAWSDDEGDDDRWR
ncbi:DUF262 domain-containing protein [Chondromyces apiculatus]|uniref:GmrSD restriction endonucleases N-terminal domain-containing protein n=1 Tax=Chondromyces apiculatus DSM 436 TaxID=1192034 RepID=A0A017TBX2_9BACT|nr:DUF262 domain-containing protein [Chondromyces apiculatus]EYF06417.1 Hypothetical protein CAP_1947 [Chondromyces apiculatus DSM 436]